MSDDRKVICTHSAHSLEFVGKVAEWLKTAPTFEPPYGAFYVNSVEIAFDGFTMGKFEAEDATFLFTVREGDDG